MLLDSRKYRLPMLIARVLRWILDLGLIFLAMTLAVRLVKETLHFADMLFYRGEGLRAWHLIAVIVIYLILFKPIVLIIKYFFKSESYPLLRYYIYLGILAMIRLIIIDHKDPIEPLKYSVAILILVATLWLANRKRLKRE